MPLDNVIYHIMMVHNVSDTFLARRSFFARVFNNVLYVCASAHTVSNLGYLHMVWDLIYQYCKRFFTPFKFMFYNILVGWFTFLLLLLFRKCNCSAFIWSIWIQLRYIWRDGIFGICKIFSWKSGFITFIYWILMW